MRLVGLDTETALIQPGLLAPPLVCATYHTNDMDEAGIVGAYDAPDLVRQLANDGYTFVLHNAPFDMAVLCAHDETLVPLVFDLYEQGRVRDTMIRETLQLIRKGTFKQHRRRLSLAALAERHLKIKLDKSEDTWRLRYAELAGTPVEEWPEAALSYAKDDASTTLGVYLSQEDSPDETLQTRAHFALHLMACWGIRTDGDAVQELEDRLRERARDMRSALLQEGLLKYAGPKKDPKRKISRDMRAIRLRVSKAFKGQPPLTEGRQISTSRETLTDSGDPSLQRVADYVANEKLLTTYVPVLWGGVSHPINARFNPIVETGRTSCSGPNLQNQPRAPGVRECYVPRDGYWFVACDYDTAELRSLSQVCHSMLGKSKMREAFLEGRDLHLEMGAQLLPEPVTYEEAVRRKKQGDPEIAGARQFAKALNFGFPGGLGADTFVKFAKAQGYDITRDRAQQLKQLWLQTWPEMRLYFQRISAITDDVIGTHKITQLFSGRVRADVSFSSAANGFFQSLTADGAKSALWLVCQACYVDKSSPLFGCRPVVFVHDEIIIEAPKVKANEAAAELSRLMNLAMQRWTPDVPATSTPHIMQRWFKKAEAEYSKVTCKTPDGIEIRQGDLIPWLWGAVGDAFDKFAGGVRR